MTPLDETKLNQQLAASPSRSAFVMANAGSGKTRVLTNRVARLLLEQVEPEKILCITFTKAAAAEMADRLFGVLGEWALADDVTLINALTEIEGVDSKKRDSQALANVRKLFARALETPGGLKIQTIHSFCEQILKRFPLEAGASPGFSIIEDVEADRLLKRALDEIARRARNDQKLSTAFSRLSVLKNETDLRELLTGGAKKRLDFEAALNRFDDLNGMISATAAELGVEPNETEDSIKASFVERMGIGRLDAACRALEASGKLSNERCGTPIRTFLNNTDLTDRWAALSKLFLKADGTPRGKYGDKKTEKAAPWVNTELLQLQEKFVAANNATKTLSIFLDTAAYLQLTATLIEAYALAKVERAALDFDDLITRTQRLFDDTDAAWVMYKLDQGIDHILIDEAQDTSPTQWGVVESLFGEFLSGAGARDVPRSFFAVGDMKQSIYSFQGADAGLFKEKESGLGKRLTNVTDYKSVSLALSFRTTEPVLTFVDALFEDPAAAEGLGGAPVPTHGVERVGDAGLVEIWPLTPRSEKPETNPWDAPIDLPTEDHPVRILSERIAATIKNWVIEKKELPSRSRPIEPGDIMILVQSRGPLFDEVLRTLSRRGVPVAGADRLKLLEDPAVEDLVSFAKFAVSEEDDLSLAEVLKSPLYGFDDDNDLFPLAYGRESSLWSALRLRADEKSMWRVAADEIAVISSLGLKEGPYAFLSYILETGVPSGRKRFFERLTEASRDAIDELLRQALEFETDHPRSLRAFINWFEDSAGMIKREMDRTNDAVRVMTVHGAKGLEANIIFLIDAQRGPNVTHLGPVFDLPRDSVNARGREHLSVFVSSSGRHVPLTQEARDYHKLKAYEEYRRLLYVAATRARDELYICGIGLGNVKDPRAKAVGVMSWHSLAEQAFDRMGERVEIANDSFWENSDRPLRRITCPQSKIVEEKDKTGTLSPVETPDWLRKPAPVECSPQQLAPSRLADADEADADWPTYSPALSPLGGEKYFRGRILHRLLELLPEVDSDMRKPAADKLLASLAPEIPEEMRNAWREEVLTVLNDVSFAPVFGPGSRAEVSIAGSPKSVKPGLTISGQIDRLVIGDKKILVVDYKTNRPPPKSLDGISTAYVAQLAAYRALLEEIYPGHQIETALLWTFQARLTPLPSDMLDHAFGRYLAAG